MNDLMQYASKGEQMIVIQLIQALRGDGLLVSVHDGEQWAAIKSDDSQEILDAMCSTGADWVLAVNESGKKVAAFQLIYGNDPDGSELISDGSGDLFDHYNAKACRFYWR